MLNEITVLPVDDHSLVSRSLRRLLEDDDSVRVVGGADSGARAVQTVPDLQPRIVLMDCSTSGGSGVTLTREIIPSHPR